ncbi:hypothetical protein F0160_22600 [Paraburkholderia sp. JPY303]|uniref:hypothetical protein n=1 Tax=Paraburkholderia atlantica TaxID=2654982 RepID=UPI001591421F|nr:hypothetical protein [Paraburkholderia atlantica]NUY33278.1 hypothetical protein [Paraburkholderia atlantica]
MKITIVSGPSRPKPRAGDRRVTKKHGEQIRVFLRTSCGAYDCTGGRQRYQWVPIADADKHGAAHYWTAEERAKYHNEYPAGYMQQRGAA